MEHTIDVSVLLTRVRAYRTAIAIFVVVATVVTAGIAFLLPNWYQATASLLPPGEEETGFGIAKLLRGASVPGIKIPTQSTPADVFLAVLKSRRLNEEIVSRFQLLKVYKQKFVEDAVKELDRHGKFKLTDAGTIDLSVEDRDPKRAAAMLQAYIDLLDQFNREVRSTKGRRTRIFVEERLKQTQQNLATAEQALADYQSTHKTAVLTPQMSTATESAARLYAERMALEVRLGVVRGYAREGSAEEQQIMAQRDQIDMQLRSLPETGLVLARYVREAQKQEQLYELLTGQYEEARIDEARDVVTVDVLDPPEAPERKVRPHRGVIIVVGFLLSLGVGVAYALFQEEKQAEPHHASMAG